MLVVVSTDFSNVEQAPLTVHDSLDASNATLWHTLLLVHNDWHRNNVNGFVAFSGSYVNDSTTASLEHANPECVV